MCTVETKAGTIQSSDSSALQVAVDTADSGDTLKVGGECVGVHTRGGHKQTVLITKSLTLQGSILPNITTSKPNLDTHPATLHADRGGRVIVIIGNVDVALDNLSKAGGLANDGWISNFGGGNIDEDPMFMTPTDPMAVTSTGDLHLKSGSPAIDAGDDSYVIGVDIDLDGEKRIRDGNGDGDKKVDMGAYEYLPVYIFDLYLSIVSNGEK